MASPFQSNQANLRKTNEKCALVQHTTFLHTTTFYMLIFCMMRSTRVLLFHAMMLQDMLSLMSFFDTI